MTRWRRDATRDAGRPVHLPARRAQRRRVVGDLSADAARARRLRASTFSRRPGDASAAATTTSRRSSTSRSRPKTTSRCGGSRSATTARASARSTSPATPRSSWRRPADDLAHPAFGKLFVETEYLADSAALLCHRRPRDPRRAAVLGVPRAEPRRPAAGAGRMGNRSRALPRPRARAPTIRRRSTAARCRARPASCSIRSSACASGSACRRARRCGSASPPASPSDRETAEALARKYHDPSAAVAHVRARLHARAERPAPPRHLDRRGACCSSASRRACSAPTARCAPAPTRSRRTSSVSPGLWPHGISGDLPILLVRVVGDDDVPLVRQVLQAQEYWRLKGLSADVVILNEHPISYLDEMQAQLTALLDDGPWRAWQHRPGRRLSAARRPHGPRRARAARGRGARRSARRPRRPAHAARSARPHAAAGDAPRADGAATPATRRPRTVAAAGA